MSRSMKNAIKNYGKLVEKDGNKHVFFASDLTQLVEMSRDKYELAHNAMMAGYMIGYRSGRKDQAEKARK